MLYLRLFHGRTDPAQDMDEWGSNGPVFGPYEFVHTAYASCIKMHKQDAYCDTLSVVRDMLYYDGVYYGDWSVLGNDFRKTNRQTTVFEQSKANLPQTKED